MVSLPYLGLQALYASSRRLCLLFFISTFLLHPIDRDKTRRQVRQLRAYGGSAMAHDDMEEIIELEGTPAASSPDEDDADRTFSTIGTPSPRKQHALPAQAPPMTQLPALKKSTWIHLRQPRGHVDSERSPPACCSF